MTADDTEVLVLLGIDPCSPDAAFLRIMKAVEDGCANLGLNFLSRVSHEEFERILWELIERAPDRVVVYFYKYYHERKDDAPPLSEGLAKKVAEIYFRQQKGQVWDTPDFISRALTLYLYEH